MSPSLWEQGASQSPHGAPLSSIHTDCSLPQRPTGHPRVLPSGTNPSHAEPQCPPSPAGLAPGADRRPPHSPPHPVGASCLCPHRGPRTIPSQYPQ